MLEQPSFGRRLRQLRTERGLSQAALAGDGMSTGYLSRLESGARQPTDRAVAHLAGRLGIDPSEFEESRAASLAQSLSIATSLDSDETSELLAEALESAQAQDPMLRWQALWLLAQWKRRHGENAAERVYLEELVALSEEIGLAELRSRALTRLARSLRTTGEIAPAVDAATTAHRLALENGLSTQDLAAVLLVLVSVEAEAGRLPDARRHADELAVLVEGRSDALWAEAMWTVVAVRVRQGDFTPAQELLEQALDRFGSRENLTLWLRLRLTAADLHLQKFPPEPDAAQRYIEAAEAALPFARTSAMEHELTALKTHLAFHEGRYEDARALLGRLGRSERRMSYRGRIRLDVLDNQLRILEGDEDAGMAGLQRLALQAQESSNIDLAATIWRLAAECLLKSRGKVPGIRG
ncbi:helix-turn-helix domain-containing protein [Streptomyces sp. NBC_01754]|uniref:helix-turn-helix domain-containing protein n=1 Tax=Streptomyces sp. NBC_01754 TaxID=2975930 RepID=UPI002DD800B8|nr:helix-turn-helix domain-containing protein [Streptomyces sp. NBC_01754]WSC90946.1 helix-turn-helix domain-containing protein [Streptomyces sp. NBC_01754]WSC96560.1 helix-turn-helix domain-containing protein [Streptomyces sp. NBC_01754]